jgi:hypothetical protein
MGCTTIFQPMMGGRCIDIAIDQCQQMEKEGYKTLIAHGISKNGILHDHAMWYDEKSRSYQLVFPDPGFKNIETYYDWKQVQKMWRN